MLLDGGETICKESGTQAQSGSNFWGTMIDKRQSNMRSSAGDLETKATLAMSKFRENIGINTKPSWAYVKVCQVLQVDLLFHVSTQLVLKL